MIVFIWFLFDFLILIWKLVNSVIAWQLLVDTTSHNFLWKKKLYYNNNLKIKPNVFISKNGKLSELRLSEFFCLGLGGNKNTPSTETAKK
jgi:hypothetical protein